MTREGLANWAVPLTTNGSASAGKNLIVFAAKLCLCNGSHVKPFSVLKPASDFSFKGLVTFWSVQERPFQV